jgi:gamma-glutamylcyclotransferase (GGCT)/AIG2-like uncharacterized protein YtfP
MFVKPTLGNFLSQKLNLSWYTPDNVMLQKKDRHYLFCYGTLMKGLCRNRFMVDNADAAFVSEGMTHLDKFIMYRRKEVGMGRYPVVTAAKGIQGNYSGKIRGEIWQVDSEFIPFCDEIEGNLVAYKRIQLVINTFDPKDTHHRGSYVCWMYIGIEKYWEKYIADFKLIDCVLHKHPKKHYYYDSLERTTVDYI